MRVLLIGLLFLTACTSATTSAPTGSSAGAPAAGGEAAAPAPAQRALTLAITREPPAMDTLFIAGPNNGDYLALGSAFLALISPQQQPRPYLSAQLPTLENGLSKILPDGSMETTYSLNPNARWHDGEPITAGDFVFAQEVATDPEIPAQSRNPVLRFATVRAIDDHTLFIQWAQPYMWAGAMHLPEFAPMSRDTLEDLYRSDKQAFINGPQWREQFVGSGPYKIQSWAPGSEMVFRAHERFVLGKPHIDEIDVKFISDPNTIVANMLSGTVDASFFVSIGFPQAQALEQAGWDGQTQYWRGNGRLIEFQQRDWGNLQQAVLDVRVRRAMLYAIDRQGLVNGIYNGRAPAIYFFLDQSDPAFPAADAAVPKYPYDPQRATQLLQEAGWTRGSDGMVHNAAGEVLDMPFLAVIGDVENQETQVVMDNWKAVGIQSDFIQLTSALTSDNEFRSKFAAVSFTRRGFGLPDMQWTTDQISDPARGWAGNNRIGYSDPVLDDAWRQVLGKVDPKQREPLIVEGLTAMNNDAVVQPIFLQPRAVASRDGLTGPTEPWSDERAIIWNIFDWSWS